MKLTITSEGVFLEDGPDVHPSVADQDKPAVAFLIALAWGAGRIIEACEFIDTQRKEKAATQALVATALTAAKQAMH